MVRLGSFFEKSYLCFVNKNLKKKIEVVHLLEKEIKGENMDFYDH